MHLDPTFEICCQKCDGIIKHNPDQLAGCLCDPDAPSWVGWARDGQVIATSHASWEFFKPKPSGPE